MVNDAWYPEQKTISVTVDGFSDWWTLAYNQTKTLQLRNSEQLVRAATPTIHIYEGYNGSSGASVETTSAGGPNVHVLWTYVPPGGDLANRTEGCETTGVWLALVHG